MTVKEIRYPERFHTGIRNTTIPNPAALYRFSRDAVSVFEGRVEDYDFKQQYSNFFKLQAVLRTNGTKLGPIAVATYVGDGGYSNNWKPRNLTRFVSCSEDGRLMWEKYEGSSAGGGQNYVFVCGMKIKLSDFLVFSAKVQRDLLRGKQPPPKVPNKEMKWEKSPWMP
jgi:hypothetical protein